DVALDRMPPPEFDTEGLGYALSPELRGGDPLGAGASPRLMVRQAAPVGALPIAQGPAYDRRASGGTASRPQPRPRQDASWEGRADPGREWLRGGDRLGDRRPPAAGRSGYGLPGLNLGRARQYPFGYD